jgi:AcrR family transcriptional regulator
MEQGNKREKQRALRKQQILECALDMIVTFGFADMTIRGIAEKLNISAGLFFNYFESKEQVYEELIRIGLSGPSSALKLNEGGIEPIALFEKMTERIFEGLRLDAFTRKMFLLMAHAIRSQSAPQGVKKLLEGFDPVTPLLSVVQRGQALGQIKEGSPRALILAYWGAVQGIAETYATTPGMPLPESGWVVDIVRARAVPARGSTEGEA